MSVPLDVILMVPAVQAALAGAPDLVMPVQPSASDENEVDKSEVPATTDLRFSAVKRLFKYWAKSFIGILLSVPTPAFQASRRAASARPAAAGAPTG